MTEGAATAGEASEDGFGRATVVRLFRAVRNFVGSEVGGRARLLALVLLGLLLGINALNVLNSYVSRFFMTAIERREGSEFVRMAVLYVGVFAALTATAVFYRYVEERLALLWRDWLTRRLLDVYLGDRTYYHLNAAGSLGNPDQRIADDVRTFTASTLSLALVFLNGTFTILAFSGVLWSISRTLFVAAVLYAAAGSLSAFFLGRPLVRLNYDQSDREADFRSQLIHVRENAESVALFHREPHLGARLRRHLDSLTANLRNIIAVNRNLSFFTTGYDYLIQIIPVLIVAPLFISGEAEFGTIPQSSMAFAHVLGAFSLVVKQFPQLSTYAAVLARLSALVGATEAATEARREGVAIAEDRDRFAFDGLTLSTPDDGRTLLRELRAEVLAGETLRIVTPSEGETIALQRAIAGIWTTGEGTIVRPPIGELLLMPDRPYLPPGTLRELLAGHDAARGADDRIRQALETVGVDRAVARAGGLDVERDWDAVLSLEEQRLLSLARILLARPRFAVLARLDRSLGPERARRLVAALRAERVGCLVLGDEVPAGADAAEPRIDIAADGTWTRSGS